MPLFKRVVLKSKQRLNKDWTPDKRLVGHCFVNSTPEAAAEMCRRKEEEERSEGCLRMPLRFSIGARRGLFGMTECLADLAGKPTQMWGWDGCSGAEGGCK
ncbi:hypothetical protein NQZ68_004575 [Dissostichus eleginoides]|nr:hypothetical protein NQZ68_004575 [Dissostichus eleginoides]